MSLNRAEIAAVILGEMEKSAASVNQTVNNTLSRFTKMKFNKSTPLMSLHDMDDIDRTEALMGIEDGLNISIPDSSWNNVKTVGDLHRAARGAFKK